MYTLLKKTILALSLLFFPLLRPSIEPKAYQHRAEKQVKKTVFLLEKIIQKPKKNDNIQTLRELQNYLKECRFRNAEDQAESCKELNLLLKKLLKECSSNFSTNLLIPQVGLTKQETSNEFYLLEIIEDNNQLLFQLEEELKKRDIPLYAQAVRSLDSFLESHSAYTISKRILPYAALAGYIHLLQPSSALHIFLEKKESDNKDKGLLLSLPFTMPKIVGQGLLKIHEKPLLELSIYSLFLPTLKQDFYDLQSFTSDQIKKIKALLKNNPLPSKKITIKSKLTFNDIIGKSEYKKLLQKNVLQRADSERGFLFIGETSSAKECAYGLAGEIKECEIFEIDASLLIEKSLKELMQKIDTTTPIIILIDGIDWLLEKENYDAKKVSEFIENIKNLTNKNKKEYRMVIGIAKSTKHLSKSFQEKTRLSTVFYFAKPSLQERFLFFKKKIAKNSTAKDQEIDLNYLAGVTEGASYEQLMSVYNDALSSAQMDEELLHNHYFEASIDKHIRFIIADEQQIPFAKKRLKAAQYAGHIVAHKILFPESAIAKATLFLVKHTKAGEDFYEHGALFTYNTHDEQKTSAASHLHKKIIYLLAGKEAQIVVHGDYDQLSSQLITKEAYELASILIAEGLIKEDLDAQTKEQIKLKTWEYYTNATKEARAMIIEQKQTIKKIAAFLEERTSILGTDIENVWVD